MKHLSKLALALWLAAVSIGMVGLWNYQVASGRPAPVPARWPAEAQVQKANQGMTLLMFAHPHCPCTRASMEELAWVMARCKKKQVAAHVLFLHPKDMTAGWMKTDLWRDAANIPEVDVRADQDGAEARRFGATTSGHVMLYNARGELLFNGGITPGRGHAGENAGREAVVQLVSGTANGTAQAQTAVFGCPLFDSGSPLEQCPSPPQTQGGR
jgi:hypothetical protein